MDKVSIIKYTKISGSLETTNPGPKHKKTKNKITLDQTSTAIFTLTNKFILYKRTSKKICNLIRENELYQRSIVYAQSVSSLPSE